MTKVAADVVAAGVVERTRLSAQPARPLAVYVHFPFCLSKCPYCDFASAATRHVPHEAYAEAVLTELERRCASWPEFEEGRMQAGSVYFGGGTPSLWKPHCVEKLLRRLEQKLGFAPGVEISLEANPSAADAAKLGAFKSAGINRLSLGIQSFDDGILRRLGRTHTAKEACQAAQGARRAGFDNLSVDLLYAIPGQSLEQACADAEAALALAPTHISLYALTLEEEALAQAVPMAKTQAQRPPEALDIAMREGMARALRARGFERYELSNYALPGKACLHNLHYWKGGDYLGLGAGAVGAFIREGGCGGPQGTRWFNHRRWEDYAQAIAQGASGEAEREALDEAALYIERCMLGLRLKEGVEVAPLRAAFGRRVESLEALAPTWEAGGWATYEQGRLRLSERGMDIHTALCLELL